MKVATWNIAGGHTSRSYAHFDYSTNVELDYFASQLSLLGCDAIFVQESQIASDGTSTAKELAKKLGYEHVFETAMSPSHIDEGHQLSNAIISKAPIANAAAYIQPYPEFEMFLPDGQTAVRHDKYLQVAEIHGIQVANTMLQPMRLFGHAYNDPEGSLYAAALADFFRQHLQNPIIFAGDFNTPNPVAMFDWDSIALHDSLPEKPTVPKYNEHFDCILVSKSYVVKNSVILKTETDHYLCWTEVELD